MIQYDLDNLSKLLDNKEDILACPRCYQLTSASELEWIESKNSYDRMMGDGILICNNCDEDERPAIESDLELFLEYNQNNNYYKLI